MATEPKRLAVWNAMGFHEAALRCRYPMSTIEPLAMVVNFALACELYFKGIYLMAGTPPRSHNLQKLFHGLPEAIKSELRVAYNKGDEVGLDDTLSEIANAFVDWRYIHEQGYGSVRHGALEHLADCLCLWCVDNLPITENGLDRLRSLLRPRADDQHASVQPPA